eukprot:364454-Chlamydomonas_euryale.AAC.1
MTPEASATRLPLPFGGSAGKVRRASGGVAMLAMGSGGGEGESWRSGGVDARLPGGQANDLTPAISKPQRFAPRRPLGGKDAPRRHKLKALTCKCCPPPRRHAPIPRPPLPSRHRACVPSMRPEHTLNLNDPSANAVTVTSSLAATDDDGSRQSRPSEIDETTAAPTAATSPRPFKCSCGSAAAPAAGAAAPSSCCASRRELPRGVEKCEVCWPLLAVAAPSTRRLLLRCVPAARSTFDARCLVAERQACGGWYVPLSTLSASDASHTTWCGKRYRVRRCGIVRRAHHLVWKGVQGADVWDRQEGTPPGVEKGAGRGSV